MASWNIRNSLNWCWGVRLKKIIWSLSFLWWNLCLFSITNINHESHQGNSVHSSRREARVDFTLQMVTHLSRSVNYSPRHHASCNTRTRGTLTRCHIRQLNHPVPSTKKNCSLWHYFHLDYSTVIILMLFLFLLFWGKGGGVLFTEACWQKYLEPENGLLWGDLIIHILILYFFKEISHPCIYFFLGTIITIPSPYQKVKIRVQKVYFFWYRCVSDHLALYFYVCMHACTRLYVVWTERKRKIDVQLWLIPTDSKKLTNTAWPCVIDIWITVICLYRNYKSNSNINYAVNRLALAQQQQEQQIQTKLTSFKGMSNC